MTSNQTLYSSLMMDAQEQLIARGLSSDSAVAKRQRRASNRRLERLFIELVTRLAPDLTAEIGAHEASFSREIRSRLPGTRVLAFEANPAVHQQHLSELSDSGVEYLNQCISDAVGTLTLRVPITGSGAQHKMGSVMVDTQAEAFKDYTVRSITADAMIGSVSNALWIDVEGAVAKVLRGAASSLRHCLALYVEMERTARWEGQAVDREIIATLGSYGLVPIARDLQRRKWQYNAVFVRPDVLVDSALQAWVSRIPAQVVAAVHKAR